MMVEEHQMIKVLLVDGHAMVRRGLRMRLGLEPDVEIVGEAENGGDALSMVQRFTPDVVVMDATLPDLDGITTTRRVRELAPRTAVVMLSLHSDPVTRARARQAGVAAFVEKRSGGEDLLVEVRRAAGAVLTPTLVGESAQPKEGGCNPPCAR
jgi:DNA-binding NarL/FixJ family response regulator